MIGLYYWLAIFSVNPHATFVQLIAAMRISRCFVFKGIVEVIPSSMVCNFSI